MERAFIHPPQEPIVGEKCILTTISPGYEKILSDMLLSLKANGGISDAQIVVFIIDADASCIQTAKQFGAHVILCDSIKPVNINSKSVLYSAHEIIDCAKFLYIDADVLVLDDLNSLFVAMNTVPPESIWAVKDFYFLWANTLKDIVVDKWNLYNGNYDDFGRLLGEVKSEPDFPTVINAGVLAGKRDGWRILDEKLRSLHNIGDWVEENGTIREQFIVNLSLASLNNLVPLHIKYNLQLCSPRFLKFEQSKDKTDVFLHSSPFRLGFFKNMLEWASRILNKSDKMSSYLYDKIPGGDIECLKSAVNKQNNVDYVLVDILNILTKNLELFSGEFIKEIGVTALDKRHSDADINKFNKDTVSEYYKEYVIEEPIYCDVPLTLLHFNGPDKSFNGSREFIINEIKSRNGNDKSAKNHISGVKFVISTHKNYQDITLPKLLKSLVETNHICPDDILVVSGGWDERFVEIRGGVKYHCVDHNSFDHTGIVEVLESNIHSQYWMIFHDTVEVGVNFFEKLKKFDINHEYTTICMYGAMNMGLARWDFLQESKNFILSLKNCGKERAFLSEYMFLRMSRSASFESDYEKVIGTGDVYGQGTTRTIRYFPDLDVYKYQANTTHASRIFTA